MNFLSITCNKLKMNLQTKGLIIHVLCFGCCILELPLPICGYIKGTCNDSKKINSKNFKTLRKDCVFICIGDLLTFYTLTQCFSMNLFSYKDKKESKDQMIDYIVLIKVLYLRVSLACWGIIKGALAIKAFKIKTYFFTDSKKIIPKNHKF